MPSTAAPGRALSERLVSLDVFRGLTMAAMVIVNDPGDWGNVYWPLLHAEWNGWTPTDLIFPFFLYIVGVSMTLSRSTTGPWWKIVKRGVTIMALGWFMSLFPFFVFATWRLPGVLVRIGICYMVAAWVFRLTMPAGQRNDWRHGVRLVGCAAALSLAYWAAMALAPFPGHTPGDLTPAGNLGAFVDRMILGQNHLWGRRPWDPEGLFSTVPALATTLTGIVTGFWLRSAHPGQTKAGLLACAGAAAVGLGLAWDLVFPINKNLWTSSYVWFTSGAGALVLAACYWLADVKGWRWWTRPFVILGVNAITLFVLAGLSAKTLILVKVPNEAGRLASLYSEIYHRWFEPLAAPKNASLLFALTYLAALYLVLWVMYRRRIFLKA
jgi:predicted acyltransferase